MKKAFAVLSAAALTGAILTACDAQESTCGPQAMGSIALQSMSQPMPEGGGSGSSGGGGGGGSRGGSSGGSSSGGSRGGSSVGGGGKSGGSGGSGSNKSGSSGGGYTPRAPSSAPDRGYRPAPGQPNYTYVRQSDGSWLPFLGGVLMGEALSDPPAGCR